MENVIKSYEGLDQYFDMVKISANKIYSNAKKSGAKAVQPELREDLYQSGMIALLEAWQKFEPEKASFRTYAFYRIRGAMLDKLRNEDTVSRSTRTALKKMDIDLNDVMTSTELSEEEVNKAIKNSIIVFQFATPDDGYEETASTIQFLDPENPYRETDMQETVKKLLTACPLSGKEKTVITEYYFNDKTFAVIGNELDITESRVSQIHRAAISKLKHYV